MRRPRRRQARLQELQAALGKARSEGYKEGLTAARQPALEWQNTNGDPGDFLDELDPPQFDRLA